MLTVAGEKIIGNKEKREGLFIVIGFFFRCYVTFWLILESVTLISNSDRSEAFIGGCLLIIAFYLLHNLFSKLVSVENYQYWGKTSLGIALFLVAVPLIAFLTDGQVPHYGAYMNGLADLLFFRR